MLQNIVSMKDTIILVLILQRYEKDAQNVVTGWFATKICSKWCNSSETLHNDREIFIGSSKISNNSVF